MTTSPLDLDALEAAEKAATPGYWCYATVHAVGPDYSPLPGHMKTDCGDIAINRSPWTPIFKQHGLKRDEDTYFIVAIRNAAPALFAAARERDRCRKVCEDVAHASTLRIAEITRLREALEAAENYMVVCERWHAGHESPTVATTCDALAKVRAALGVGYHST